MNLQASTTALTITIWLCVGFAQAVIERSPKNGMQVDKLSEAERHGFTVLDSQLLVKVSNEQSQQLAMTSSDNDVADWQTDNFEPYTDELDSYVTASGVPDPLDDDEVTHQRYASWLQNYKRIPNLPKVLWSYNNADSGPDIWSSLDKNYMLCDADLTKASGSPIDVHSSSATAGCYGPSFPFQSPVWETTPAILTEKFDRSFIVDVANCKAGNGCKNSETIPTTFDHAEMVLERIVFHTPSEHKLNGKSFDMELQFMHCRSGGSFAAGCKPEMAIAIFLQDGGASQVDPDFISKLGMTLKSVGADPRELAKGLQFQSVADAISPLLKEFYVYTGSTTYPPCYQGVEWYIANQELSVSSSIIAAFKAREGENVRPTFELGTRTLQFLSPEAPDHWTYRGPRGAPNWAASPLSHTFCGTTSDCEKLHDQASRDKCHAAQNSQSPIDISSSECSPSSNLGIPCAQPSGLIPLSWNIGNFNTQPLKIYLKDCSVCLPCNNKFNGYTLTLVAPGTTTATSLNPNYGGCNSFSSCRTATGYTSPTIAFQNSIYALREIVFHTPAEHTVDGIRAGLEVQLVSDLVDCVKCTCPGWGNRGNDNPNNQWCCCTPNNNANTKLIQSILFSTDIGGGSLSWISKVASLAGSVTGEPLALAQDLLFFNIARSLDAVNTKYFYYTGSLSTPPCSTNVQWIVVKNVQHISSDELQAIAALSVGGNSRGVQPLNGRSLLVAAAQ